MKRRNHDTETGKAEAAEERGREGTEADRVEAVLVGGKIRRSVTTGRLHICPLPVTDGECYWSGDPYAPHELGF